MQQLTQKRSLAKANRHHYGGEYIAEQEIERLVDLLRAHQWRSDHAIGYDIVAVVLVVLGGAVAAHG